MSIQIGDFPKAVEVAEEAFDSKYYLHRGLGGVLFLAHVLKLIVTLNHYESSREEV